MSDETLDEVRRLLESCLQDTEDGEVHYNLRTSLQLLVAHREELTDHELAGCDGVQRARRSDRQPEPYAE